MTTGTLSDSRLANVAARQIRDAWSGFADRYRIITRRARLRFEQRDWAGMAADHLERLDLYSRVAADSAVRVGEVLAERSHDRMVWAAMKAVYSGLISERPDLELAETFFNSVTRRIFTTVGVDNHIEFVDTDFDTAVDLDRPPYRTYQGTSDLADLLGDIVADAGLSVRFRSLDSDLAAAAEAVSSRLHRVGAMRRVDRAEVVDAVFFRGKGAYLVGRLHSGSHTLPLVLALLHPEDGVAIDAVLLTENQVSILFSFTRSYFHVDTPAPRALIDFLSTLMPRKRRAELYISVGYNKHGKTELYRELRRHLAASGERFQITRGTRGLVMVVFTLPGFDVVFKVIKDRFGEPKRITRDQVRDRYRLVFHHDRAGRLVDAQEFEHLEFARSRFEPELAEWLLADCARVATAGDDTVSIAHCYVERRVTPLDVYLADAEPDHAEEAILDYGQAIKDMAASGVFPGDMLLKNFGVTRHGRVVFYDYDELSLLGDCVFRGLPTASSLDDEMAAEPWFPVGPDDVFPEEFPRFLGITGELRRRFMEVHADLFRPETWLNWQRRVAAGEMIEIYPYEPRWRLESGIRSDR